MHNLEPQKKLMKHDRHKDANINNVRKACPLANSELWKLDWVVELHS